MTKESISAQPATSMALIPPVENLQYYVSVPFCAFCLKFSRIWSILKHTELFTDFVRFCSEIRVLSSDLFICYANAAHRHMHWLTNVQIRQFFVRYVWIVIWT